MTPEESKSKITAAFERYVTGAFYALTRCKPSCVGTAQSSPERADRDDALRLDSGMALARAIRGERILKFGDGGSALKD